MVFLVSFIVIDNFRWLQPPNYWMVAELESNELLSFCIKRVKGLNKVKLVDASWVCHKTFFLKAKPNNILDLD